MPAPEPLRLDPVTSPAPGFELCYECRGQRICWLCDGVGSVDGERCNLCTGTRRCVVCRGAGQLTAGTEKEVDALR